MRLFDGRGTLGGVLQFAGRAECRVALNPGGGDALAVLGVIAEALDVLIALEPPPVATVDPLLLA